MAHAAALASLFFALLAAPLILGAGVALQRAGPRARLVWLGTSAGLLAGAVASGALALVLTLV